ncbi:hypothetical protein B566_EDAN004723 [Ephemera danica]|nr:hypothetical protein B566_EDAN004723 [Ephemera danica]
MKLLPVLVAVVVVVQAYPDGAPLSTCGDMTPQHGKPAQNSPSPYSIKLSKTSIRSGGKVYVTLEAPSGDSFKGFIIQGRVGQEPTAATHKDKNPKEKVTVAWTAPPGLSEKVIFYYTCAL